MSVKLKKPLKFLLFCFVITVIVFTTAETCLPHKAWILEFSEQPPAQVTNCVNGECEVTLKIKSNIDDVVFIGAIGCNEVPSPMYDYVGVSSGFFEYEVTFTIGAGTNNIDLSFTNPQGTLKTLSCTVECVCPQPGGYILKNTLGAQSITRPIDISFDTFGHVITLTLFDSPMGEAGKIMKLFADLGTAHEYYTNVYYLENPLGVSAGFSGPELFLLYAGKIKRVDSSGVPQTEYLFSMDQTAQTGQITTTGDKIRSISRTTAQQGFDYLNTLFPANTAQNYGRSIERTYHGVDSVAIPGHDRNGDTIMYTYAANSSSRAVQQVIWADPENYQAGGVLFNIPESDGIPKDITIFSDDETIFKCLVTTERTDGSFWVNLYCQAGIKLYDFKAHDSIQGTPGEYVFSAVKGKSDDYIYVIHSLFPGVQVWEYQP